MKAIILTEHGGVEKFRYVEDFPKPQISPTSALVRIRATSVNRADIVVRNGYPGLSIPLPHIVGGDIVGTIEELGEEVSGFSVGDRVIVHPVISCHTCELCKAGRENLCLNWQYFGMHIHGSYAEYASAPAENLVKISDSISFESATAFGVAGLTAYHALFGVANLKPNQTFMIWGGSGGLGTIAVQLAKAAGATVIATVGKDEKRETIHALGADFVFNHYTDDVQAEVMKRFPFGVDVILDYVGPATFPKSFLMAKKGGQILLCGILTGRESMLSLHQTYLRHISVHGLYLGTKAELSAALQLADEKTIKPLIDRTFPLAEAAEAHRTLESGNYTGKLVLLP